MHGVWTNLAGSRPEPRIGVPPSWISSFSSHPVPDANRDGITDTHAAPAIEVLDGWPGKWY